MRLRHCEPVVPFVSIAALATAAALSGCLGVTGTGSAPTDVPAMASGQASEAAAATDDPLVAAAGAPSGLVGVVWQWTGSEYSNDTSLWVSEPAEYTLEFTEAGEVRVKADCNAVVGTYVAAGAQLDLRLGAATLGECGEGSLSEKYIAELGDVVTFVMADDGRLVLNLKVDAGNMLFVPTGG